jgi:hypothetical protein
MKDIRIFNIDHKEKIRSAIRNQHAETYILITLLSFAASVSLTRFFLYMTGYPQIGGGELHIAHVLWGGLILFASSLILLIYANEWAYDLAAAMTGVGVGLFIDEVGKFITRDNNYFYPSAAPIIYAFFLLTILLFTRVRKPRNTDSRSNLYHVLENLEELLDRDLNPDELQEIQNRLDTVIKKEDDPNLKQFAVSMKTFLSTNDLYIAPKEFGWWEKFRNKLIHIEKQIINRSQYRLTIILGMMLLAFWSFISPAIFISRLHSPKEMELLLNDLVHNNLVRNASGLNWFEARFGLEGVIGLLLLISAVLMIIGKDKRGVSLAYISLLFSLTVVNLLLFYFNQFSTILVAFAEFCVLLVILRYRKRYDPN